MPKVNVHYPTKDSQLKMRLEDYAQALNGGLEFGSVKGPVNIRCFPTSGVSPVAPNTEFTITHNLGYVPSVFCITADVAGHIYASRRAQWTKTQAFFKSDQASVPFTGFVF